MFGAARNGNWSFILKQIKKLKHQASHSENQPKNARDQAGKRRKQDLRFSFFAY